MQSSQVLILNYHSIYDPNVFNEYRDPVYSVSIKKFERDLNTIIKLNLPIVSLGQLKTQDSNNRLRICLTFDDGHASDFEKVYPILESQGILGNFFPTLLNISSKKRWIEYQEMASKGHLVGSHGINHKNHKYLSNEEQLSELQESKKLLEIKLSQSVNYYSLPEGDYNAQTIQYARELGYHGILSSDFGFIDPKKSPFVLNRLNMKESISTETLKKLVTNQSYIPFLFRSKLFFKNQLTRMLGKRNVNKLNYLIRL